MIPASCPDLPRLSAFVSIFFLPLALLACEPADPPAAATTASAGTEDVRAQAPPPATPDADGHTMKGEESLVLLSELYRIESRFDSMEGPWQSSPVVFEGMKEGEVVWLRGIENIALEEGSGEQLSDEFLCHSNLNFAGGPEQHARHNAAFAATANLEPRVLTLIQGRNDIQFPPGYGFPVQAGEPLEFFSMVINKNREELPLELRVQTTLRYLREAEAAGEVRPLFRRRLFTFVAVPKEGTHGDGHAGHGGHGGHAGQGNEKAAMGEKASEIVGRDRAGNEYTFHWMVPPGRHRYRTALSQQLSLPFDTTAHYITAHMHPYGESVEIIDLTTGESVIQLGAQVYQDGRVGIAHMDEYSDPTGITLHADHDYELVTVYNNTKGEPIDAMAIVYLFLLDKDFEKKGAAS